MIFRVIRCDLNKIIRGKWIILCILMVFGLCLFAQVYQDPATGQGYTVLSAILDLEDEVQSSGMDFNAYEIVRKGISGWLSLFIPILAAFPAVTICCDERQFRYIRYERIRSSRMTNDLSKLFSAFLTGSGIAAAGYALFILFALLRFRAPSGLAPEELEFYAMMLGRKKEGLLGGAFVLLLARRILDCALWGGLNALPAMALTGLTGNKYLALCIPFFLKYAFGQLCMKINLSVLSEHPAPEYIRKAASLLSPDALPHLSEYRGGMVWEILGIQGLIGLLWMALYLFLQKRRVDWGE